MLAAVALAGSVDTDSASASSWRAAAVQAPAATAPDWDGLRRGIGGTLYRPDDAGYAAAHQLFNPRFDSIRPAGVVRSATVWGSKTRRVRLTSSDRCSPRWA